jgi:benzoate-CoA ligase family protein
MSAAVAEIGLSLPRRYNAAALLFDNLARGRGAHPAVTGPAGTRSYAALAAAASRHARALAAAGLAPQERVILFLDDTPDYPAAFFGAIHGGFVPVLVNTATAPELLNFYLRDSGAAVAIIEGSFADRFDATACAGTALRLLVLAGGGRPDDGPVPAVALEDFLRPHSSEIAAAATERDDMAFWQYSSGTTGRPKGIVHRQGDMAHTAASYGRHVLRIGPGDICLSVPKIFFAYGLGNSLAFPFSVGATSVLLPGQPKPGPIFAAIARYRPSLFFGLPTLYTAMAAAPEAAGADLSSIRLCLSAAEVLAGEVAERWKRIGGHDIIEGLGSTEMLHIYLSNTPEAWRRGAAGRPVPGYEVELRDPEGRAVGPGEEGILRVRGGSAASCYWNRPDKTAATMLADGWIDTGDRMLRDAEGFYVFRGRADELIKVSGQWVWPLEVELCLADHPAVRECAVLAIEQEDRRMTLRAFVVLADPDADPDTAARLLQDHVKRRLMPHKYPRQVSFLDVLPKTGSGKIDRQALRADPGR